MEMTPKKIKILVLSGNQMAQANITFNNKKLEQVNAFNYLGSTITED